MSRSSFPWPQGPYSYPSWRTRHLRTGDTTPPSRPQGAPDPTRAVPYHEKSPTGHYGGYYADFTRAMGLGEPPTADVINRAIYDISCALDTLFEWHDANLDYIQIPAVNPVAPDYEVDLRTKSSNRVVYLGRYNTLTPSGTFDSRRWCNNFIKVRDLTGANAPVISMSGQVVEVIDVRAAPAGISLYTSMPGQTSVFPYGTPGRIAAINNPGGPLDDSIEFVGDTLPSGLPTALLGGVACLFNYSLMERGYSTGASMDDAFAISYSAVDQLFPLLDQFTVNRNNLSAIGWLAGDYVYTTHFAWNPTILVSEDFATSDIILWHGRPRPSATAQPGASRFVDLMRAMDFGPATSGIASFEVAEPAHTVPFQRFFDYANALFRAKDSQLKGTVGFDALMHYNLGGGAQVDAYAGFLHRKSMAFNSPNNTVLKVQEPVTWVGATVTLVAVPPVAQFYGASAENRAIVLGTDLVELREDPTHTPIGLFILNGVSATQCTLLNLDGTAPALAAGVGDLTIFRPQLRTGIWDPTVLPDYAGGNLMMGDDYGATTVPPLVLMTVGSESLLEGWHAGLDRVAAGAGDGRAVRRLKIDQWGKLLFSGQGTSPAPPAPFSVTQYGAAESVRHGLGAPTTIWGNVNSTSRSIIFSGVSEGSVEPWETRSAGFHFVDDVGGGSDDAFLFLSPDGDVVNGLPLNGVAGVLCGFPGNVQFPAGPNLFVAGSRDAAYFFGRRSATGAYGVMGISVDDGALGYNRYGMFVENPNAGTAPALAPFGYIFDPLGTDPPARFELDDHTSLGWRNEKTFYHSVPMAEGENTSATFVLREADDGIGGVLDYRYVWYADGGGGIVLGDKVAAVFPLHLPDGSVIRYLDVWAATDAALDGDAKIAVILTQADRNTFTRYNFVPAIWNMLGGLGITSLNQYRGVAGPPAEIPVVDGGANPGVLVVNRDYHYYLTVMIHTLPAGKKLELGSVRIRYTLQDLLPA